MQQPREVAQGSRPGRATRMAPAILFSNCSRGSQRKGSRLEGLSGTPQMCYREILRTNLCIFFSLQEKFCMHTSLCQITDDARLFFWSLSLFLSCTLFGFFFLQFTLLFSVLDSYQLVEFSPSSFYMRTEVAGVYAFPL